MNITELLVTDKSKQRPSGLKSDNKDKLKLSDFLQYPTLEDPDPVSNSDNIELRTLKIPATHDKATLLISRLVEATGTLEVLEVLHDAYQLYCDGELIIDFEAGSWPGFWQVVFSEFDPATVALDQTSITYRAVDY